MIIELVWDSKFFKRKIGRLTKVPLKNECKKLIQKARKEEYKYLTARIIFKKIEDVQLLEKHGFYITDIGCVWEAKLDSKFLAEMNLLGKQVSSFEFQWREATLKDAPMLKSMVKGLFRKSRFYNDPFFTKKEADKVYQAWVQNTLQNKTMKTFLVEGCGVIACKKLAKNNGTITLIGVVSKARKRGLGRNLILKALKWFRENGVKTVTVRTQINNISAMNFYDKIGFSIKYFDITMGLKL